MTSCLVSCCHECHQVPRCCLVSDNLGTAGGKEDANTQRSDTHYKSGPRALQMHVYNVVTSRTFRANTAWQLVQMIDRTSASRATASSALSLHSSIGLAVATEWVSYTVYQLYAAICPPDQRVDPQIPGGRRDVIELSRESAGSPRGFG
jgi:hypothetical protein